MKIVIEPVAGSRFMGKLYIEDECVDTVIDIRPGCCTRILMNRLLDKYGKPDGEIILTIDGW
jgi:hypothetical protein